MKNNKAITLLELLIAMSLLTLIIFAASGIYLSGWRMFRDAQFQAQAQRNAMVPMAHIVKNLQEAISFSLFTPANLYFLTYEAGGGIIIRRYFLSGNNIIYVPNVDATPPQNIVIGTHIPTDETLTHFSIHDGPIYGIVATITITAYDNNDNNQNSYTITSTAEARYGSSPPIFVFPVPV